MEGNTNRAIQQQLTLPLHVLLSPHNPLPPANSDALMCLLLFCFIFLLVFVLRGDRSSHNNVSGFASELYLYIYLYRYLYLYIYDHLQIQKEHVRYLQVWHQVSVIIHGESVNLFHILSHLLWQVSVCNVCSIQNQNLLLPLCIFLTSIIHSKFQQWC